MRAGARRAAGGESLSGSINRVADRYYEVVRRSRIDLSPAELGAVRDALSGWLAEPAATIYGGPALEVQDALADGLAERHGIDGPALVAKLRGLTYAQEVALVDSVEQHWRSSAACAVQMHSIAHAAQSAYDSVMQSPTAPATSGNQGQETKMNEREVRISAARYVDYDDCLAAAAAEYSAAHDLAGWDLAPRWDDEQRDEIILTVPAREWFR